MKKNKIVAMAIAAIAEELKVDIQKIRVLSFEEIERSGLEKYIEINSIPYKKYQLGD